jgi:HD-like signal output (HDOD) protein
MIGGTLTALSFKRYPVLLPDAVKASSICNNNNSINAHELFTLVNADPVLTAICYGVYHEFFPAARKEFFGAPRIIIVLGVNTIKNFIAGAIKLALSSPELCIDLAQQENFLRNSLATAIMSHLIARERGVREERLKEYYCAGLLYNIGEFIISDSSRAEFVIPRKLVTPEEAGRLTAALWGFPSAAADAASHRNNSDAAINAALSAYIVKAIDSPNTQDDRRDFFKLLNVPEDIFDRIKTPFKSELKRLEGFLGLGGGGD